MAIGSFLESYDFGAKTIIPFITHGGSGASRTVDTISELQPGALLIGNELVISRNDAAESEKIVVEWAQGLDLIPAVEGTYSSYAEDTTSEGLQASRDYRAFAGFSMGCVATWRTFQYCLDYFRYFMPSSGNLTSDGNYMATCTFWSRKG